MDKKRSRPYGLTKSKLLSYRQCPKRLWLEENRPDLTEINALTNYAFEQGQKVGAVAQMLYGAGPVINFDSGATRAVDQTRRAIAQKPPLPVYEATFVYDDVLVRTDVLIPSNTGARVIEIKSTTSVKEIHREDCAIQAWVLERSGLRLQSFHLAHVNGAFIYQGDGHYQGLITEVPLNAEIRKIGELVSDWVDAAKAVLLKNVEPTVEIGEQCTVPHACPFIKHCWPPETDFPLTALPSLRRNLEIALREEGYEDIRDIPEGRLSIALQDRVRRVTVCGKPELDPQATEFARTLNYPRYYLDFETIGFAVPVWAGTRPYQPLPFQWSCHIEQQDGSLDHEEFLDLSGTSPLRSCIEQLILTLGDRGPIITYSPYEKRVLNDATILFPDLTNRLAPIIDRLIDLLPIMRRHYYHPDMKGSWSIKAVLPTIAPDLAYSGLEEVQDGTGAQQAYLEAIAPTTDPARRDYLDVQLRKYCARDTLAMRRIVTYLDGGQH